MFNEITQHLAKVTFVQHDEVVKTFSPECAYHPLSDRVRSWSPKRCQDRLDPDRPRAGNDRVHRGEDGHHWYGAREARALKAAWTAATTGEPAAPLSIEA